MRQSGRHIALCMGLLLIAGQGFSEEPADAQASGSETEQGAEPAEPEAPVEDPLVTEGRELRERLAALLDRATEFDRLIREATNTESRLGLEEQNWRRQLDVHATVLRLTQNLLRREQAGIATAEDHERLSAFWQRVYPRYIEVLEWRAGRADEARSLRDAAPAGSRLELEKGVSAQEERLQILYRVCLEALAQMEPLGIDTSRERAAAEKRVSDRADTLAGRLRVAAQERDAIKSDQTDGEALATVQERINRITSDLSATTALLASLELETAAYQQLLITVTGEITPSIFDVQVLAGLLSDWQDRLVERVRTEGPSWLVRGLVFVAILVLFRFLAALTRRVVQHAVGSGRVDISMLLRETLVSWSSRMVNGIGLLVALSSLGLQIGPLLAGLGIAGFIVGFALQDSLSNFAAGAMILAYRPFDVGDVIEAAGVSGKVQHMSLVSTTIHTFDNQTLILPNTRIWGDVIRNVTDQHTRRIDLMFRIGLDDDIDHADAVVRDVLAKCEEVLSEPEPIVEVDDVGEWCVELAVRPWVRTEDYWQTRWGLNRTIKQRLDREGLRTPVPRSEVQLRGGDA